jgi:hypothetical protein
MLAESHVHYRRDVNEPRNRHLSSPVSRGQSTPNAVARFPFPSPPPTRVTDVPGKRRLQELDSSLNLACGAWLHWM